MGKSMGESMGGWMNQWADGRIEERINGRIDGRINERIRMFLIALLMMSAAGASGCADPSAADDISQATSQAETLQVASDTNASATDDAVTDAAAVATDMDVWLRTAGGLLLRRKICKFNFLKFWTG